MTVKVTRGSPFFRWKWKGRTKLLWINHSETFENPPNETTNAHQTLSWLPDDHCAGKPNLYFIHVDCHMNNFDVSDETRRDTNFDVPILSFLFDTGRRELWTPAALLPALFPPADTKARQQSTVVSQSVCSLTWAYKQMCSVRFELHLNFSRNLQVLLGHQTFKSNCAFSVLSMPR